MRIVFRFARRYMRPYALWYAVGLIALVLTNALGVRIPVELARGIDALALGADGRALVGQAALRIALMGAAVIVIRTVSRVFFFTPGRQAEAAIKRDLFHAILAQQPAFLRDYPAGDLFSRLNSDVNQFRLLAGFGVLQLANTALAIVFVTFQMTSLSPKLAFFLAIPLMLGTWGARQIIARMFALMRKLQAELATLTTWILSSYRSVQTVQGFRANDAVTERFDELNHAALRSMLGQANLRAALNPSLALATDIDVFLVILIGGPMTARGEITIGELIAFTTLVGFITNPLRGSAFLANIVKQAQASLERIAVILEHPPDRSEGPHPAPAPKAPPEIEFRDLSFTWPGASQPALSHVSLRIRAGGTLGVLGLTGSGKSTLVRLLSRLETPPPGCIFVDGIDLRDMDLDAWREASTILLQHPFLYSESIAHNIGLGRLDDDAISEAIRDAQLEADLDAMPQGKETRVGESGVRLSGGQRQRTALARGLARPSVVRIIDDTLSAVDHTTERALIDVLQQATDHAHAPTTILIAHRVSALMHADLVLVLDHGRAVQLGSPQELLEQDGLFRETWQRQSALEVA